MHCSFVDVYYVLMQFVVRLLCVGVLFFSLCCCMLLCIMLLFVVRCYDLLRVISLSCLLLRFVAVCYDL